MTAVTYTARRSIIPGHSIDNQYSIDLPCIDITPSRRPKNEAQETLSGDRETMRYHAVVRYAVSLAPLKEAELLAMLEFLDSVESGEPFTFDPYGSVASPVLPISGAHLDEGGYEMPRRARGQGGANDFHMLQFTVRAVVP